MKTPNHLRITYPKTTATPLAAMPFANSISRPEGLVPEGQARIARRFNAGNAATAGRVPKGRLKSRTPSAPSAVPSGLLPHDAWVPNAKALGYSPMSLRDKAPLKTCSLTNGSIYFSDPPWTNYPNRFYLIRSP